MEEPVVHKNHIPKTGFTAFRRFSLPLFTSRHTASISRISASRPRAKITEMDATIMASSIIRLRREEEQALKASAQRSAEAAARRNIRLILPTSSSPFRKFDGVILAKQITIVNSVFQINILFDPDFSYYFQQKTAEAKKKRRFQQKRLFFSNIRLFSSRSGCR